MKSFKLFIVFIALFGLSILNPKTALSTEYQEKPKQSDFKIGLGLGVGYRPDYLGSNDYKFMPLPVLDVLWKNTVQLSTKDCLKLYVLEQDSFKMGTSLNYKFKRKESENKALKGLGDLGSSVEAGIFLQYQHNKIGFNFDARQDVSNGHQGFLSTAGINHTQFYNNRKIIVNTSLSTTFADKTYMNNVFGINHTQANNSGYGLYKPNAGIRDVSLGLVINEK